MNDRILSPATQVAACVPLPGSKSISNRALLLAALAQAGQSGILSNMLVADDTREMFVALQQLGVKFSGDFYSQTLTITPCGNTFFAKGKPTQPVSLHLGNAGTAFRPLTAVLGLSDGYYVLDGVARMRERPIGDLVATLNAMGAQISYLGQEGYPPLGIAPCGHTQLQQALKKRITIRGEVSSQFVSALLMSLPLSQERAEVQVVGELISKPYVAMTLRMMEQFGVVVEYDDSLTHFVIPADALYRLPACYAIESDASSASYFLAAGALAGVGEYGVKVQGVGLKSIQGDVRFIEALRQMGAEVGGDDCSLWAKPPRVHKLQALDLDCNHIPDAAMTLAVLALFAEGTTILRNIASWRVKETDRIQAMATELRKLGAVVETSADTIRITPPVSLNNGVTIATYDDHRMAMCFALVCLGGVSVRIADAHCVNKTFPSYFEHLEHILYGKPLPSI